MKKLITLLLCAVMLFSAVMPVSAFISESETAPMVGDANGDGKVDTKDSHIIKASLSNKNVKYLIAGADTTGDGVVNTKDSFMIKKNIAVGTELAPGAGNTVERIVIGNAEIASFEISLPADATENMQFAASELRDYIKLARGAELDIVTDSTAEHRIVISLDTTGELGVEGVDILCKGGNLYITGGTLRGCMYGVYDFLEKYIGWVFINDENIFLNKNGSIVVEDGSHYRNVPTMEFRDSNTYSYHGNELLAPITKLKISSWRGRGALEKNAKYGYSIGFVGTAHTMADYCDDIDNSKQICYSDPTRYDQVLTGVLAKIADVKKRNNPCPSISVSPMDNTNYCICRKCRAKNKDAQSYMGSQLDFVNRIAADVEKEYPEVHVLTLAYWLARIPPKNDLVPAENVDILYCWSGCNNHPYDAGLCSEDGDRWWYTNVYDTQYFEKWIDITQGKVYVWHYSTSYHFYLGQPDIIDNIRQDIKYMADKGADGIYCEGYYGTHDAHKDGNSFDLLTMYLLARCMWEPDMSEEDYNSYIEEFMYWYYGDGFNELVEYRKMCGEATEAEDIGCWVNNGDMVFDCISEIYYAENNDKIFELIDTALQKTLATGTKEQYDHLVHLAAGAYWLCLASTYDTKYTNGTAEERALFEERYTQLYNWMIDYNIVDLDGNRVGFDNATKNGLDFGTDPYLWTGLTSAQRHDTAKRDKPEYR